MGISGFFKWLTNVDNFPNIKKYCIEEEPSYDQNGVYQTIDETKKNPNNIEFDNLYLDLNEIIYSSARSNNVSELKNEDQIIKSIFDSIDRIFSIVRPRKLLYIAIDGVAPRAKLHNQRTKRFLELKDTMEKSEKMEEIKHKILVNGGHLPENNNQKEKIKSFDENCITPGTSFMAKLSDCLRYYIYNRMNKNQAWREIKVIFSNANEPGEGEHKIIDYIRRQCTQSDYDENTNHVLYGNDADLILLGLSTHTSHVRIMREDFKPTEPRPCEICRQLGHDMTTCKGISKEQLGQYSELSLNKLNIVKKKYIFVDLSMLRDELCKSLEKDKKLQFKLNRERFLNDWIFICLLVGNDFLPNLPSCEVHENVIKHLMDIYKTILFESKCYLTNNGVLDMKIVEVFFKNFGKMEPKIFKERHEINQQRQQQFSNQSNHSQSPDTQLKLSLDKLKHELLFQAARPSQFKPTWSQKHSSSLDKNSASNKIHSDQTPSIDASTVSSSINVVKNQQYNETKSVMSSLPTATHQPIEDNTANDTVQLWEDDWHEQYYKKKFGVNLTNLEEFPLKVAQQYAHGLLWVLQYYNQGVPSWDWYYPYHYAPFASDFLNIKDVSGNFNDNSIPLKPLEQLLCIIPPQYAKEYLPNEWLPLILQKDSPIIDFYPSNFNTDLNGRRFESQRIALLPFVDVKRLQQILEKSSSSLTSEEEKRNQHEYARLFIHSKIERYNQLKKELDVNIGKRITQENPSDASKSIGISGHIWQDNNDDKIIPIGKTVNAPMLNYDNISKNQVMCIQYCN